MKSTFLTILFLVFDKIGNTNALTNFEKGSKIAKVGVTTYVVNHEIEKEEDDKDTLEEVHTYAQFKRDPRANLPSSFTICSSVMTTYYKNKQMQVFFNLLGNDGNRWLGSFLYVDKETSFYHLKLTDVKLLPVFAHQWVRSCMAVDSDSGLLQWVVDGTLVENTTVAHIKDSKNKPTDLTDKIVLGAWQYSGSKKWGAMSNRVTNLNIFSDTLTIGAMKQYTKGENCTPDGDYLAWGDMQWKLKGEAKNETVDVKEPCIGQPFFNLYSGQYSSMQSCKYLCGNMGSRSRVAKCHRYGRYICVKYLMIWVKILKSNICSTEFMKLGEAL